MLYTILKDTSAVEGDISNSGSQSVPNSLSNDPDAISFDNASVPALVCPGHFFPGTVAPTLVENDGRYVTETVRRK